MPRTATPREIQNHYNAVGYQVRIGPDGHVTYRDPGGDWLEGRYVEEYRVEDDGRVRLFDRQGRANCSPLQNSS